MRTEVIYQTLKNDENPDGVEQNGPFKCERTDAWLGIGYYFWEGFIENAHWWGKSRADYKSTGYFICEAYCTYDHTICFDLVDSIEHRRELQKIHDEFKKQKLLTPSTTIASLLSHVRKTTSFDNIYQAIRALDHSCKSFNKYPEYSAFVKFDSKPNYKGGIDLISPIQICLLKANSLQLKNYKVIYPESYSQSYLI